MDKQQFELPDGEPIAVLVMTEDEFGGFLRELPPEVFSSEDVKRISKCKMAPGIARDFHTEDLFSRYGVNSQFLAVCIKGTAQRLGFTDELLGKLEKAKKLLGSNDLYLIRKHVSNMRDVMPRWESIKSGLGEFLAELQSGNVGISEKYYEEMTASAFFTIYGIYHNGFGEEDVAGYLEKLFVGVVCNYRGIKIT